MLSSNPNILSAQHKEISQNEGEGDKKQSEEADEFESNGSQLNSTDTENDDDNQYEPTDAETSDAYDYSDIVASLIKANQNLLMNDHPLNPATASLTNSKDKKKDKKTLLPDSPSHLYTSNAHKRYNFKHAVKEEVGYEEEHRSISALAESMERNNKKNSNGSKKDLPSSQQYGGSGQVMSADDYGYSKRLMCGRMIFRAVVMTGLVALAFAVVGIVEMVFKRKIL